MSTLHETVILDFCAFVLAMMPGCLFPAAGKPIEVPVYRDGALERTLPVSLFYDLDRIRHQNDGQPAGLVVYSVGFSACTPSAKSLAVMFAERGYVFAVPAHNDIVASCLCLPDESDPNKGLDNGQLVDNPALAQLVTMNGEKNLSEDQFEEFFYYRNADLCATVESLTNTETHEFGSLRDKPVILAGYSLGGWDVLNIAGAANLFPELHCDVAAVICQNTFVGELTEEQIQRISCPVLYFAGVEDPLRPNIRLLFDWRPTNSYLVEIAGADHYIFATDLCSSPILSAMHPSSCDDDTLEHARKVNELTVDFISVLTATNELPLIEDLGSYSPDLFTIIK